MFYGLALQQSQHLPAGHPPHLFGGSVNGRAEVDRRLMARALELARRMASLLELKEGRLVQSG